jgi:hypothetical protein
MAGGRLLPLGTQLTRLFQKGKRRPCSLDTKPVLMDRSPGLPSDSGAGPGVNGASCARPSAAFASSIARGSPESGDQGRYHDDHKADGAQERVTGSILVDEQPQPNQPNRDRNKDPRPAHIIASARPRRYRSRRSWRARRTRRLRHCWGRGSLAARLPDPRMIWSAQISSARRDRHSYSLGAPR